MSYCSIMKQNVLPRCWAEGAAANSRTKLPYTALCGSHRQWKMFTRCQLPNGMLHRLFLPGEDTGKRQSFSKGLQNIHCWERLPENEVRRVWRNLYIQQREYELHGWSSVSLLNCENTVFVPLLLFCTTHHVRAPRCTTHKKQTFSKCGT